MSQKARSAITIRSLSPPYGNSSRPWIDRYSNQKERTLLSWKTIIGADLASHREAVDEKWTGTVGERNGETKTWQRGREAYANAGSCWHMQNVGF